MFLELAQHKVMLNWQRLFYYAYTQCIICVCASHKGTHTHKHAPFTYIHTRAWESAYHNRPAELSYPSLVTCERDRQHVSVSKHKTRSKIANSRERRCSSILQVALSICCCSLSLSHSPTTFSAHHANRISQQTAQDWKTKKNQCQYTQKQHVYLK